MPAWRKCCGKRSQRASCEPGHTRDFERGDGPPGLPGDDGKVVESGPALEFLAKPRSAYKRALFAAAFDIKAEAGAALGQ